MLLYWELLGTGFSDVFLFLRYIVTRINFH
jgi:hypothetical protein